MQIFDRREPLVREKIVHRESRRITGIARAELKAGLARVLRRAHLHHQLGRVFDQLPPHLYHGGRRRGQPEARRQACPEQFIDQHTAMLGIVLEFHHVIAAVVTSHQMRLRATPHSPDVLESQGHFCRIVAAPPGCGKRIIARGVPHHTETVRGFPAAGESRNPGPVRPLLRAILPATREPPRLPLLTWRYMFRE